MKFGLALPTAADLAGTAALAQVAAGAERIGLDSVWSFERLIAPTHRVEMGGRRILLPDLYDTVYSPLEVLAYVAATTSKVRLGTSVMVALLHNPVDLARRFATLDQLSNGRVVIGLGQGWMTEEFEAAGVPKDRMGAGFGEFLAAMRAVWAADPVSFDGRFYRFTESRLGPKPVQPGGPPIVIAATAPASVRRTAEAGLGINPIWYGWDALSAAITQFHDAVRDVGNDPAGLPIVVRVNGTLTKTPRGSEPTLVGSPDQVAEAIPRLEELGVTEVFWQMSIPVDEQLELMSQLVD